ncbi:hypothetical protein ACJJTC_000063 [Scirpophaga incertulas]
MNRFGICRSWELQSLEPKKASAGYVLHHHSWHLLHYGKRQGTCRRTGWRRCRAARWAARRWRGLWLDRCRLRRLPAHALRPLHRLHLLSAEDNELTEVEEGALGGLRALRTLRLARNALSAPPRALAALHRLQIL